MTRNILKITFTLMICIFSIQSYSQDILPELKPGTVVDDTVITLGDLFTNLSESNDLVVTNAPEPGQKLLVPARLILQVTRAHNVRWRNSAGVNNVVVSRMSTIVGYTDLSRQIAGELKNLYHTEQNIDVRFYNRNGKIHLPNGFDASDLTIRNISLDKNSDKFSALVAAPNGQGGETLHTVNGRTIRVTMIPTLARTIRNGDVISNSDIKWTSLPDNQVNRNIVRSSDKLIGMTPRSLIKVGSPIRLNEVDRPILVKRGELVKINFNTSKISLSTLGKAVENGGKGDVIQVRNNASNKIVSAVVLGPNLVEVHADASSLVLLNP